MHAMCRHLLSQGRCFFCLSSSVHAFDGSTVALSACLLLASLFLELCRPLFLASTGHVWQAFLMHRLVSVHYGSFFACACFPSWSPKNLLTAFVNMLLLVPICMCHMCMMPCHELINTSMLSFIICMLQCAHDYMYVTMSHAVLAHACPMQADICQLGLDQRKVNVLAREYCDQCKPKRKLKPVILSHEMMPGLLQVSLTIFDLTAFLCSFASNSICKLTNISMAVVETAICT